MNSPACTWGCEFKADAGDTLGISKLTCPVVDESNLNIMVVQFLYDKACVLHQSFWTDILRISEQIQPCLRWSSCLWELRENQVLLQSDLLWADYLPFGIHIFIVCKWCQHILELPCSKTKMMQMKESVRNWWCAHNNKWSNVEFYFVSMSTRQCC